MTREVGAITGELDLETTLTAGRLKARIAYADADEWYTPRGSPLRCTSDDPRHAHQQVLARLTTPGPIVRGNEQPVDLVGLRL